jgi:hypothetical protein
LARLRRTLPQPDPALQDGEPKDQRIEHLLVEGAPKCSESTAYPGSTAAWWRAESSASMADGLSTTISAVKPPMPADRKRWIGGANLEDVRRSG